MATKTKETEKLEWSPLPQMNIKKCGGDPKQAIRDGKQTFMCRIYGEATDVKTKEARSGDAYTYLVGAFRGIGPDGTKYESDKLFLPGGIQESVEASYKAGGEKPVTFAYDIFANEDKDSSVGYRYAAKALMKTEASSRLDAMSQEIGGKALPK